MNLASHQVPPQGLRSSIIGEQCFDSSPHDDSRTSSLIVTRLRRIISFRKTVFVPISIYATFWTPHRRCTEKCTISSQSTVNPEIPEEAWVVGRRRDFDVLARPQCMTQAHSDTHFLLKRCDGWMYEVNNSGPRTSWTWPERSMTAVTNSYIHWQRLNTSLRAHYANRLHRIELSSYTNL